MFVLVVSFFFFKLKTAYDMRISDWSSDVCSSDLLNWPGIIPAKRDFKALDHHLLVGTGHMDIVNIGFSVHQRRVDGMSFCPGFHQFFNERSAELLDRKSTRLNSSH